MIYLDELRDIDVDMSTDEKVNRILNYLKNMKDSYEANLKALEKRIETIENKG